MTHEYATPVAFRTALEHRLRDRAAKQGTDLSRLRQILVFERFLERAFRVLGPHAVLKGGAALELRIARARTTRDIDLRVFGEPDSVLELLRAAGREDLGDWLSLEIGPDLEHPEIEAEGLRYGGRRFRAEARIAGVPFGLPFGVDIAFAEPFHGDAETVVGSDLLEFVGVSRPSFLIYPIEAHIAEKLHAYSLPRARPNSRVKDLPDIALLSTIREIDSATLLAAIANVFDRRATHPRPANVAPPPDFWAPVYARMAKTDRLPWKDVAEVHAAARAFLDPVLSGSVGFWRTDRAEWS